VKPASGALSFAPEAQFSVGAGRGTEMRKRNRQTGIFAKTVSVPLKMQSKQKNTKFMHKIHFKT